MKYKIIMTPSYTNVSRIGLELIPENEPLKFFLSGTKITRFPDLLKSACLANGFSNETSIYRPYSNMDWEDIQNAKGIKEDEVEIYHQIFGSTYIKQRLFNQILFDYSMKLLEVYRNRKEVPEGWDREMESGIENLKTKL